MLVSLSLGPPRGHLLQNLSPHLVMLLLRRALSSVLCWHLAPGCPSQCKGQHGKHSKAPPPPAEAKGDKGAAAHALLHHRSPANQGLARAGLKVGVRTAGQRGPCRTGDQQGPVCDLSFGKVFECGLWNRGVMIGFGNKRFRDEPSLRNATSYKSVPFVTSLHSLAC